MPIIKRWFPVSHDINADPEVIELTDNFGLAGLKVWLELLSISDRNEGTVTGDYESIVRSLSIKCNTTQSQVRGVLELIKRRLWISSDLPVKVLNYWKYHKTRGTNKAPSEPSEPSEPNITNHKPPIVPRKKRGTERVVDFVFENFWDQYPRKVGKGAAYKSWCKEAKLCTEIQSAIFEALTWQRGQPQWLKNGGQYIPHPTTWLNQRRWEDKQTEVQDHGPEPKGFAGLRDWLKHQEQK